jgi:hypothetical protein
MANKSYGHFCKRKAEYTYSLHSILFIVTVMLSFSSMGSLCIVLFSTINTVIDFIPARLTVERPTLLSLHTYQFRWHMSSGTNEMEPPLPYRGSMCTCMSTVVPPGPDSGVPCAEIQTSKYSGFAPPGLT